MTLQEVMAVVAATLTIIATWWKLFSAGKALKAMEEKIKEAQRMWEKDVLELRTRVDGFTAKVETFNSKVQNVELDIAQVKQSNDDLKQKVTSCDECSRTAEMAIAKLTEAKEHINSDIVQVRAELGREANIMSNQLATIHQKIDQIDTKLDKLRDRGAAK